MKLLPQYSIRLMLGITAALAGVFSILGLAVRGQSWAIGISVGLGGLVVAMLTYVVFFGILWVFSVVASPLLDRPLRARRISLSGTSSPFAGSTRSADSQGPFGATLVGSPFSAVQGDTNPVRGD